MKGLFALSLLALSAGAVSAAPEAGQLLLQESFEDTMWATRGWYDGPHMVIVADATAPHGDMVNLWRWPRAGATGPTGGGARLHLPPVSDVTLSFSMRVSDDWSWTGVPFHPHMFHFLTNAD